MTTRERPDHPAQEGSKTVDSLVQAMEASIKATCELVKLPVKCYSQALDSWANAVNKAIEDCKPCPPTSKEPADPAAGK